MNLKINRLQIKNEFKINRLQIKMNLEIDYGL